ncbi:response regulator transcription factor, partial [Vibrio sp. 10N.261.45.A7]
VVIDYEMLEQLNEQHHFHISCNVSKVPIIIINCEDSINLEEVALWTSVMGIFYIKDYIETLYRGFSFVIDGNIWLSRGVSQKLLNIYRSKIKIEDTTQDCLLTKREWQILKLVGNGLTNSEISNQIHVAEGTVKTHVYNIYKKVRVKNRVEAILWLKSVEGNLETELKHKAILERFNDG